MGFLKAGGAYKEKHTLKEKTISRMYDEKGRLMSTNITLMGSISDANSDNSV